MRIGAELRQARERLGWELPAVAAHLRIRLAYLEAIEAGRNVALPTGTYAVGFVRSYAHLLGLDAAEAARRFRGEAAELNRPAELSFPVPAPERGVPAGAIVLVGVVLAIGAYVGWYRISEDHRPGPEPVAALPERLAPLAERHELPSVQAPQPRAAAPAPAGAFQPTMPQVPPSSAAAAIPSQVVSGPPPIPAPPPVAAPAPPPPLGPPAVLADPSRPDGSRSDATRVIVRARSDAWVQVRDRQGQVLINRVMHAGEAWPVPTKPQLVLTTGNAAGTELVVDGSVMPSLGGDGVVRRGVSLDVASLKAEKPPPTAVAATTADAQPKPAQPKPAQSKPGNPRPAQSAGSPP